MLRVIIWSLSIVVAFAAGAVMEGRARDWEMQEAVRLLERANADVQLIYEARSQCSTEDALRWWAVTKDLSQVREQLCGKGKGK